MATEEPNGPNKAPDAFQLPPESRLSALTLRVRDPEPMLGFYHELLGLPLVEQHPDRITLEPTGSNFRLEFDVEPEAPLAPQPSVGLYHLALLLPNRRFLAQIVDHLVQEGAAFQGFADHGVSEAAYLTDPEGNGIELYRDRDPSQWPHQGDEVAMVTQALDVDDLLTASGEPTGLHHATRLGHVHLHVPSIEQAGAFYRELGLHVTQSTYPGALFLAAGDYHHHVGLNTWAGNRRAPEGATGLVNYTWAVGQSALGALEERLDLEEEGTASAVDPAGVRVRFKKER